VSGNTEPVPRVKGSRSAKFWIALLLLLVLVVGAGNLLATYEQNQSTQHKFADQQSAQQKIAQAEVQALCRDLGTMAALKPPSGSAVSNPSRAYEQAEHNAWAGLFTSIRCP
jgi:uncharacterized protein HemX